MFTWLIPVALAATPASVLQFENGATMYRIEKSRDRFGFGNGQTSWSLAVRDCNRTVIESYWNKLRHATESVHRRPASVGTTSVSFEGVSTNFVPVGHAFETLVQAGTEAQVLRAVSDYHCRKTPAIK